MEKSSKLIERAKKRPTPNKHRDLDSLNSRLRENLLRRKQKTKNLKAQDKSDD